MWNLIFLATMTFGGSYENAKLCNEAGNAVFERQNLWIKAQFSSEKPFSICVRASVK